MIKLELAERIEEYLKSGFRIKHKKLTTRKTSKFDWNTEKLTEKALMTR
ncbi:hypothetical protein RCC89_00850 [Cytophagaceae bacterium ABcell3]|nr:hypothetical protein RCC89_00850 [Cytophagaceae bacterium ABcell3]